MSLESALVVLTTVDVTAAMKWRETQVGLKAIDCTDPIKSSNVGEEERGLSTTSTSGPMQGWIGGRIIVFLCLRTQSRHARPTLRQAHLARSQAEGTHSAAAVQHTNCHRRRPAVEAEPEAAAGVEVAESACASDFDYRACSPDLRWPDCRPSRRTVLMKVQRRRRLIGCSVARSRTTKFCQSCATTRRHKEAAPKRRGAQRRDEGVRSGANDWTSL